VELKENVNFCWIFVIKGSQIVRALVVRWHIEEVKSKILNIVVVGKPLKSIE